MSVKSEAFSRWFKDSVVKDRDAPKVVYHGTPDGRGIFSEGFKGGGNAFFATDSYPMASSYANANEAVDYQSAEPGVLPLYLSIQNPLIIDWEGKSWREKGGTLNWILMASQTGRDGLIIQNVLDYYNKNNAPGRTPGTVYVWFNPRQAKSAATGPIMQSGIGAERGKPITGSGPNRGTFDPNDPTILNGLKRRSGLQGTAVLAESGVNMDKKTKTQPICRVQAGAGVRWAGELTPTQCARFQSGRELGQGEFATAYEDARDPTRVVKFTGDALEAAVAARFLGKNLKGSVNVFDIAKLRGQSAVVAVPDKYFVDFDERQRQPIFALITERVGELSKVNENAIRQVSSQLRRQRDSLIGEAPSRFRVEDWVDLDLAIKQCQLDTKDKDQCRVKVNQVADAIDEQARNGVIPLDLHTGNWGERPNGDPVILDFGMSSAPGPKVRIDLAKAPRPRRCRKGPKGKACRGRLRRK
jgi:hypothetical protein